MLSAPKPRPMPRSAKVGMLLLALTVGTMLTFFTFLPGVLRKAHAAAPVPVEQVVTFTCETDGLGICAAEVDRKINHWMATEPGVVITARLANLAGDRIRSSYAVTIFYWK